MCYYVFAEYAVGKVRLPPIKSNYIETYESHRLSLIAIREEAPAAYLEGNKNL